MILHIQEDRYLGRSYTELLKDIKSDELESLIKSIKTQGNSKVLRGRYGWILVKGH
jgi:hypothetical protein